MRRLSNGELENMVLDVLWDRAVWSTPREVHEAIVPDRELAYTTVMTILSRLWRKGALEREKAGKAFAYRPVFTREERAAQRMTDLLLASGDDSAALARFVEGLSPAQRDDLRKALHRRTKR